MRHRQDDALLQMIVKMHFKILFTNQNVMIKKLDRVAQLVTDPHGANSTTRQKPPVCNAPLYIAETSKTIIIFLNYFDT